MPEYSNSHSDPHFRQTAASASAAAGTNAPASAAFAQAHAEHVHNSRQAVFSSSSVSSSSSAASFQSSTPSGSGTYSSSRNSSSSLYPHNLGDPTSAQSNPNDPDFSPFGGYPVSSFPLHIEEKEPDDYMHNPDPILDANEHARIRDWERRGVIGLLALVILTMGALCVFIIVPVLTFTGKAGETNDSPVTKVVAVPLSDYTYPTLKAIRTSLVDPDTPDDAKTITDKNGKTMNLVFSDEFNQDGRTFYEDEDQFWYAADLNYAATEDKEWYSPDAVTTVNGTLLITMDAYKNKNLDYRSGMLHSWNRLCFTGGKYEVSASLPGKGSKPGFWPGIWAMGNLGRPGYLATTEGTWPYSYNECDVGITPNQSSTDGMSYLPGQRLNSCTCKGEDHPNRGTGRSAPEIDAIEGAVSNINTTYKVGSASQSLQIAPFDIWYLCDYDYLEVYNASVTSMNTYTGGVFQQAISGVTVLNNDWYDNNEYQSYSFEYSPGAKGYIQWGVGDDPTYAIYGEALRANGNVGQRLIPMEPMSMIINLGISDSWTYIDWPALEFPSYMRVDYVRIYQLEGSESITCDPDGYPTTDYIADHPKAYKNANMTSWTEAGYDWPKNSYMDGC
ncbi:beta-glucan synthesis-associated [Lipomyces oligophaga]|uniref:beta-glucan synthesis-associated n=1 Tax=Lipomyces oligophaga TaxID=45792 RepID=UPI0034CEE851